MQIFSSYKMMVIGRVLPINQYTVQQPILLITWFCRTGSLTVSEHPMRIQDQLRAANAHLASDELERHKNIIFRQIQCTYIYLYLVTPPLKYLELSARPAESASMATAPINVVWYTCKEIPQYRCNDPYRAHRTALPVLPLRQPWTLSR